MILVDTGPLVALFDPRDARHDRCRGVLETIREPVSTTVPVLTEVFHMLSPGSHGADRVRDFVTAGGRAVWFMEPTRLQRAFELMEQDPDHPMDLADASLIVAAEALNTARSSPSIVATSLRIASDAAIATTASRSSDDRGRWHRRHGRARQEAVRHEVKEADLHSASSAADHDAADAEGGSQLGGPLSRHGDHEQYRTRDIDESIYIHYAARRS